MLPPKAWPMHWWPRQTPSSGISPASSAMASQAHPAVLGPSRPRRDEHGVGPLRPDAGHVDGVVAEHDRVGPELAQLLDQVVDEGVVVVDDQHPGSHGPTIVPAVPGAPSPAVANLCPRGNQHQRTGRRLQEGQVGLGPDRQPRRSAATRRPRRAGATPRRSPRACATARPGSAPSSWSCSSGAWPSSRSTTWPTCRSGARLALGPGDRPGDDLRRLPAGHPLPLTTAAGRPAAGQPSRSMMVALASPPPSHMVSSP